MIRCLLKYRLIFLQGGTVAQSSTERQVKYQLVFLRRHPLKLSSKFVDLNWNIFSWVGVKVWGDKHLRG